MRADVSYGEAARERIAASVALYRSRMAAAGTSAGEGRQRRPRRLLPRLKTFAADLVEEMDGIAEGAGVAIEDIVLVNARTEIVAAAQAPQGRGRTAAPASSCCPRAAPTGG